MDCADVESALISADGRAPPGPELEAHLAECESCRFLVSQGPPLARALSGGAPAPMALDLAALEQDVMASVAGDRGVVAAARTLPRFVRVGLVAGVMVLSDLFFYIFMRRSDWDAFPVGRLALVL